MSGVIKASSVPRGPPHFLISIHDIAGNSSTVPSSGSWGGGGSTIGTSTGYIFAHAFLHLLTFSFVIKVFTLLNP